MSLALLSQVKKSECGIVHPSSCIAVDNGLNERDARTTARNQDLCPWWDPHTDDGTQAMADGLPPGISSGHKARWLQTLVRQEATSFTIARLCIMHGAQNQNPAGSSKHENQRYLPQLLVLSTEVQVVCHRSETFYSEHYCHQVTRPCCCAKIIE